MAHHHHPMLAPNKASHLKISDQEQGIHSSHLPCRYPSSKIFIQRVKINRDSNKLGQPYQGGKPKTAVSAVSIYLSTIRRTGFKENDPPEPGIDSKIGNY
jgi:hypothetical protein